MRIDEPPASPGPRTLPSPGAPCAPCGAARAGWDAAGGHSRPPSALFQPRSIKRSRAKRSTRIRWRARPCWRRRSSRRTTFPRCVPAAGPRPARPQSTRLSEEAWARRPRGSGEAHPRLATRSRRPPFRGFSGPRGPCGGLPEERTTTSTRTTTSCDHHFQAKEPSPCEVGQSRSAGCGLWRGSRCGWPGTRPRAQGVPRGRLGEASTPLPAVLVYFHRVSVRSWGGVPCTHAVIARPRSSPTQVFSVWGLLSPVTRALTRSRCLSFRHPRSRGRGRL